MDSTKFIITMDMAYELLINNVISESCFRSFLQAMSTKYDTDYQALYQIKLDNLADKRVNTVEGVITNENY